MKCTVTVDFEEPLSIPLILQGREMILLDTNALIMISRASEPSWLLKLFLDWRNYGAKAVCGVCDFIRVEAINVENWFFGRVTVLNFLRKVEDGQNSMYVEVKTPIVDELADKRALFLNFLPRDERRIIISDTKTSQTDKCLVLMARHFSRSNISVSIVTADKALINLSKKLLVKTYAI
ncbi:MAG: hypothetical protein QXJ19_04825 [Candidatus Bathyarchaeia archaeon]|nr:hypothetical protein [Candidatus Bathyarchaeota archaeon]